MNLISAVFLMIFITVSAFSVIFIKYQNRYLNIEISKNDKTLYETSERYRSLLREKNNLTDRKLQKSSLGQALDMKIPNQKRILIMNLDN